MSAAEVEAALEAGAVAARAWGRVPVASRAGPLSRLATHLRQDQERYADLVSREMGKPLAEARAEVEKSAATAE
jgi:acyl-CoA reductase-like NAD-dependent aldehyde dehydrogenase